MTINRKTIHKSGVRLKPIDWLSESVRRRARSKLLAADEKSAKQNQALARQLMALRSEYRRNLAALIGAGGMRRYRELREKLAKAPRAQRIREARRLLEEIGFDRVRAERLRKQYRDTARKLLKLDDVRIPPGVVLPDTHCSPWVTYTAPYGGFFWSFAWSRSDEASNPVLTRHLDNVTGQIGSAIDTRLSGADDDDFVEAEYYTALNTWHTAQATGPLEGYLAFEFSVSTYSGRVSDEYGFSNATFSQLARARFRVSDTQNVLDTQESRIFNFIDTDWGDGTSWSNFVSAPRDIHWYYFKTAESFAQGSALVLEAGVWNSTWYFADDESITTADDLDLRLDRIMVRSCPS
jgi:hypothetical protein